MNVVVARHRRRRVWRRERASAFVATIVALSMVSVTLAPVVGAGAANIAPRLSPRVITKVPSSPCPWMGEARHHTQTATQMASQVVARMTSADLAHFVVLRAVAGVENINVGDPQLCIPSLTLVDGPGGIANGATGVTQFPSELSVAASFSVDTARQVGFAMGREALTKGFDVLQAPDLNLIRSPLDGRAFETYGEDPFLASVLGAATIEGIQSTGVMAEAKHLGAYTQENGRARLNQMVSARALVEVYDAPFRAAVTQAHVASIMCAMGAVNGKNTCSSPWLYATLRRWGFHGFVRSDYAAVTNPAVALRAGMSIAKPATSDQIMAALRNGTLPTALLRRAVTSILTEMFAYGLITHPRRLANAARATSAAHVVVALRAARQGIVLLKNTNNVLPLAGSGSVAVIGVDARQGVLTRGGGSSGVHASSLETPLAALQKLLRHVDFAYAPGGRNGLEFDPLKTSDVTSGTTPPSEIPVASIGVAGAGDVAVDNAKNVTAAALTATSPGRGEGWSSWHVTFAPEHTGTYVMGFEGTGDTWLRLNNKLLLADRGLHGPNPQSTSVELIKGHRYTLSAQWFSVGPKSTPRFGINDVQSEINRAVQIAKKAHTAVVFAGNLLSEGADLSSLLLPGDLNALISAVAAANPRTVVVLNTGGPIVMPWRNKVAGIVEAWYGGQETGPAIAQVLAGVVDPSGRLPVTMPGSRSQTPAVTNVQYPGTHGVVNFAGLSALGYRWYQANSVTPAYPFGFGLSYTTFALSHVRVAGSSRGVEVTLHVANTGRRSGIEVVQVYVGYPTGFGEPLQQLRGIGRIDLAAGATKTLSISLPRSAFTYDNGHALVVARGAYTVNVATSSASVVASQTVSL